MRVEEKKDIATIKLRGVLVDITYRVSSDYQAYVTRDKRGVNQLLPNFQNSLYGKMVAILIYYSKFTNIFTIIGFEIKPYDLCIANNVIDGSQTTIFFYVDE